MTKHLHAFWVLLLAICALAIDSAAAKPFLLNAQQPNAQTRPQYIRDHYTQIESLKAFDGMVINTNSGWVLMDGSIHSYAEISNDFAPLNGLTFSRMKHNFAFVTVDKGADFFGDWTNIIENFRMMGRVLKEKGIEGIFFDNEEYRRLLFNYPTDVSDTSKTLKQYQDQARLRGTQVMQALVSEHPGIVFMVANGPYTSFSGTPNAVRGWGNWDADELRGPFSVGLVEGLGSQARFVDAGECSYVYRSVAEFQASYDYRKYTIASDAANCPYIPAALRPLWASKVGISFALYNRAWPSWMPWLTMDPSVMRTVLETALRRADDYVWLYYEGMDWNTAGGIPQDWITAVEGAKNAVVSSGPQSPTVSITSPANGATFTTPPTISINTNASDPDGTVSKVEFFSGSTKLGEATTTPFNFTWTAPAAGAYTLTAKATDNSGMTATSAAVNITLGVSFIANINFQVPTVTPPAGYLADNGDVYGSRGNGLTYGWNISHTLAARERGGSTDVRLATLIQIHAGGIWEVAVPNGTYNVTVGVGDGAYPSTYTINVENVGFWAAQSLAAGQFVNQTRTVTVSDGKLSLNQGNGAEEATRINYVQIAAAGGSPNAPGNLTANAVSAGAIDLAWTDNSTDEIGFKIERSAASDFAGATQIATLAAGSATYRDTALTGGTVYYYRVRAYNNAGNSAYVSASASTQVAAPLAPAGLSATAGNASVALAWSTTAGATSYNLKRSTVSGGTYSIVASGVGTTYSDAAVSNGTTYYYVVSATNTGGESANSTQASAQPVAPVALAAVPTALNAVPGNTKVSLSWNASSGATSYNLKRGTVSGGPYSTIAAATTATGFVDTAVTNDTTYFYVVSARNSAGESANSTPVSAKPVASVAVLAAPIGLRASAGNAIATLSWNADTAAISYNVKRSTVNGGPYLLLKSGLTAPAYSDSGLSNGTTYFYVVTAVNASGESANSAQVGATPAIAAAAPASPSGLTATPVASGVALAWNASAGAASYNVKRATSNSGPYTMLAGAIPGNTYTDTPAVSGTTYFYVVTANIESGNSKQASAQKGSGGLTPAFSVNVNFQAAGFSTPAGYIGDLGDIYATRANGLSYGWNLNHLDYTRTRGTNTDTRLNSLMQIRSGGIWEAGVPNGTYSVTVGVGDASYPSTYTVNVEGVNFWNAQSLAAAQFVNLTKTVTVSDGKLTLNQGNAADQATRINYVIIKSL